MRKSEKMEKRVSGVKALEMVRSFVGWASASTKVLVTRHRHHVMIAVYGQAMKDIF